MKIGIFKPIVQLSAHSTRPINNCTSNPLLFRVWKVHNTCHLYSKFVWLNLFNHWPLLRTFTTILASFYLFFLPPFFLLSLLISLPVSFIPPTFLSIIFLFNPQFCPYLQSNLIFTSFFSGNHPLPFLAIPPFHLLFIFLCMFSRNVFVYPPLCILLFYMIFISCFYPNFFFTFSNIPSDNSSH